MDDQELEAKKRQARLAMAGEDFVRREKIKEEDLESRRREAVIAMESPKHRTEREERERFNQKREEGKKMIAAEKERRAKELAKRQQIEAEKNQREKSQRELENLRRQQKFQAKQDILEDIKSDKEIRVSPLRTMSDDMEQLGVFGQSNSPDANFTVGKKIIYRSGSDEPTDNRRRRFVKIITAIVLPLIIIIFFFVFSQSNSNNTTTVTQITAPLIFTEDSIDLDITDKPSLLFFKELIRLNSQIGTTDKLTNFNLTVTATTSAGQVNVSSADLNQFVKKTRLDLSSELTNYLGDRFMVGSYSEAEGAKIFFIFTVEEYDYAKSWIRKNEAELLASTLGPTEPYPNFFNELKDGRIEDITIKNLDARAIKNSDGKIIALYAWLDQKTLLVAQDIASFTKIIEARNTPVMQ